jgi:adenylyltransferase/sulfurtransferase
MSVKILIPTPLRPFTGQSASVELAGREVGALLTALAERHAELRAHLFREDGRLRSFVNVYVNDEDIRHRQGLLTPVGDGDVISIVPSVAGGAPGVAAEELPALSNEEVLRYSRHLIVPEVGLDGQRALKGARVLCVGAGGLGSPASLYLAAAGVGTLGLVDFDVVDETNLQRQILFSTDQVGQPKLASAASRLRGLNPGVNLRLHETRLTRANALDIVRDYDLVVDGADNFPTRYLVNDACVLTGRVNVYASIFRFDGQASVFGAPGGPCYRCLYPEPPPPGLVPSCAEGGVLGVLPGLLGTIQATEAIKLIIGAGTSLVGRLLLVDALTMEFRSMKLRRDPACPVCGDAPTIRELVDYEQFCGIAPPVSHVQKATVPEVSVEELKSRIDRGDRVWILDVREQNEFAICRIPGSTLIPLGELAKRLDELPVGADAPDIVVHCKMGGRSAKAVALLTERGVTHAVNLRGGILAWIDRIDPTQPKY